MPEGPSIILFKRDLQGIVGKRVREASGAANTLEPERLTGKRVTGLKSHGKHLLICFGKTLTLRIHFLMFGIYRFDRNKAAPIKLHLGFDDGSELNFYTCSLRLLDGDLSAIYDWRNDIMSEEWATALALKRLAALPPDTMICDALLNQEIFAGLGNIMKNEVLFDLKIQPESGVAAIPRAKLKKLIEDVVAYAHHHTDWWHDDVFDTHWRVYTRKICPRDGTPITKRETGKGKRTSHWCAACQKLYC